MGVVRADVAALLREGLSNAAIARQLGVDRHGVGNARRALGLAPVPAQPLTLEEKWQARTRPVPGGHLEWTGGRGTASGTPVLRYCGQTFTAARIAFRVRTGRDPAGQAKAECGMKHCVAPDHVDDTPIRTRDRAALAAITGTESSADTCRRGHGTAHRRYLPDGRPYCGACHTAGKRTAS